MLGSLILLLLMQQAPNGPSEDGVVEGVLKTSAGRPAAGVRVTAVVPPTSDDTASGAAMASIAQTDAEGRYRLERIPPGQYYIAAGRSTTPSIH